MTGVNFFSAELAAKRLELLRELVPGAARVAVLVNPANAATAERTLQRRARRLLAPWGCKSRSSTPAPAARSMRPSQRLRASGPTRSSSAADPFFNSRRVQLATLAARHAVPAIYSRREYAEAGGLMSYGTNIADAYRQVGVYAGRILKGAKPADLPVVQSTKFELVINLKTARMLGLDVPPIAARPRRRGDRMKRREFITLLGGAAAAWPLAARAQQRERMRRIGVLMTIAADDSESLARLAALLHRLQELGWVDGRNMRIEYRWAPAAPTFVARSRPSWLRSRPTSSLPMAPVRRNRCCRLHAPCRSCSCLSPIRSVPGSSTAWRGRAATPPDSPATNTA